MANVHGRIGPIIFSFVVGRSNSDHHFDSLSRFIIRLDDLDEDMPPGLTQGDDSDCDIWDCGCQDARSVKFLVCFAIAGPAG